MDNSARIGDFILRFGDIEASGNQEVRAEQFIEGRADRDIQIEKRSLKEFYATQFRVPDYQREYEWEEEEWGNLWGELETLIEVDPTAIYPVMNDVFFGSMFFSQRNAAEVLDPDEDGTVLDIIDGQQRITTLSIVFKILADHLTDVDQDCDEEFHENNTHHVGDTKRLVYKTADPNAGVSLLLDNKEDDFYQHLMQGDDERLDYILSCDVVNNNSIYGAIEVQEYLDLLGIDYDEYLGALFDYDEHVEDSHTRPNLNPARADIIDRNEGPDTLSEDQRDDLLTNKVAFDTVSERLARAYEYFHSEITAVIEDYPEPEQRFRAAANIKDYILNEYLVGYFEVKDNRTQLLMRIFEVLNDQGVDLKKTDLIRTRLVTRLRDDDVDEEVYNEYFRKWQDVINTFGKDHKVIIDFLTTYFVVIDTADGYRQVTARGEVSNHLLEAFRLSEQPDDNEVLRSQLTSTEDATALIDSIKKYASYYHDIQNPVDNGFQLEGAPDAVVSRCNQILLRLNRSNADIWEPIVLAYYHDIDNGEMGTANDLVDLLQTVESLVIRYYAAGDINIKDQIYANAMSTYHSTADPEQILRHMVETAHQDESIIGEALIDSLCTTEWDANRAKQVFRMIDSSHLDGQDEGVITQRLNRDNSVVHLEHIFPESPLLSDSAKYDWVRAYFELEGGADAENPNYFGLDTDEYDLLEEGLSNFDEILEAQIDAEADQNIEDIAEQFSSSLGNQLLLWHETNLRISNKRYADKLPAYGMTDNFDQLASNGFIRTAHMTLDAYALVELHYVLEQVYDEVKQANAEDYEEVMAAVAEEYEPKCHAATDHLHATVEEIQAQTASREECLQAIQDRLESDEILQAREVIDQQWTLESTTRNLVKILEEFTDVLRFDAVELLDDEFADVNIKHRAQREMNRKRGVIGFNYAE